MAAFISGMTAGLVTRSREGSGTAGAGAGAPGTAGTGRRGRGCGPAAGGAVGGPTGAGGSVGTCGTIGGTQDWTLMETRSSTRLGGGTSLASVALIVSMNWK